MIHLRCSRILITVFVISCALNVSDLWAQDSHYWTNQFGKLWASLPKDFFAAYGANSRLIAVCPSLDLVVVEGPGTFEKLEDEDAGFLARVIEAKSG